MTLEEEQKQRLELRELRKRIAQADRSVTVRDRRLQSFEEEVRKLRERCVGVEQENGSLKEENKKLKEQLAAMEEHRDKLAGFLFKTNQKNQEKDPVGKGALSQEAPKKRGGQRGHTGHGKQTPQHIDVHKHVFLTNCPSCENPLSRASSFDIRTVEDIPPVAAIVTEYVIERQWCRTCKKEVSGIPTGTMPGCHLGMNVITLILTLKYRLRTPLAKIQEFLKDSCGIELSEGGIQDLLHNLEKRFKTSYDKILSEIRAASVKHADETSWRIEGQNSWAWVFTTRKATLYTIEETRGKGIPERILGEYPIGVLVHDDYGAYQKLPLEHQSCFAHLIRVCREASMRPEASEEAKNLSEEVHALYRELALVISEPFEKKKREKQHNRFSVRICSIVDHVYTSTDAKKIQTRITHQKDNLLTAILHRDVPLTNNHAERQIRPLVITRKISGGSQSLAGARTHAVLMSIIQTIFLKGQNLRAELHNLLQPIGHSFTIEETVAN